MKRSYLYLIWAALFALCAGLGFLPNPVGGVKALCIVASVAFFVPPMVIIRGGHRPAVMLVRNLALVALALDLVLLVLNILSASFSESVGTMLHYVLVIAASPMVCARVWALVLFLWAFVLQYANRELKK